MSEPVMSDEAVRKINNAVKACLHHCYDSGDPLATLAEFSSMLRTDPAWNESDIAIVESRVRQMLKAISNPSSDSGIFPPGIRP
jgi:hypothetical protein